MYFSSLSSGSVVFGRMTKSTEFSMGFRSGLYNGRFIMKVGGVATGTDLPWWRSAHSAILLSLVFCFCFSADAKREVAFS